MKLPLKNRKFKNKIKILALSLCMFSFSFLTCTANANVYAASLEELAEAMETRKALPVESNEIENWPKGPLVGAESAIVM